MTDDSNVFVMNPDLQLFYADELLVQHDPSDQVTPLPVSGIHRNGAGPVVRLGAYELTPSEARWTAQQLQLAADAVDPDGESRLHTRADYEAARAAMFGLDATGGGRRGAP